MNCRALAFVLATLAPAAAFAAGPKTGGIPGRPYVAIEGGVHDPVGSCYEHSLAIGPAGRTVLGWRFSRIIATEVAVLRTTSASTKPGHNPVDVTEWSADVRLFPKRFDVVEPNVVFGYSPDSSIRYSHQTATYSGASTDLGVGARFRGESGKWWMSTDLRYRMVRYTRGRVRDASGNIVDAEMSSDKQGDAVGLLVGLGLYF